MADLEREVDRILQHRSTASDSPKDTDLLPVIDFLLGSTFKTSTLPAPSSTAPSGATSTATSAPNSPDHWYCTRAKSKLHHDAATFLIFLFAFKREGSSKTWLEKLAVVLTSCEDCACAFGAARRQFRDRYLSNFSVTTRVNFFNAVDRWQATLVMDEYDRISEPGYGISSTSSVPTLLSLSPSFLHLVFNEPTIFSQPRIADLLDLTISIHSPSPSPSPTSITALGLTPVLVHLLSSSEAPRRAWALAQLPMTVRHPIAWVDWAEGGVAQEVQALYEENWTDDKVEQWRTVKAVVQSGGMGLPVVQQGLIEGKTNNKQSKKGLMAVLSTVLGADSTAFPETLECFAALLRLSPTRHIWTHDRSPEHPHTLFSDIKNNPAFQRLLDADNIVKGKGKDKAVPDQDPLGWMTNFLLSVNDVGQDESADGVGSGLVEALARSMSFCFAEIQHARVDEVVRAACAEAGCHALITLQPKLSSLTAFSATVDVHATFLAHVAFNSPESGSWAEARSVARRLVDQIFRADGREILERVLGMGVISHTERLRLKRARKDKTISAPVQVNRLTKAVVREELWSAVYGALSTTDSSGAALILGAIAPFAHVDLLSQGWDAADLGQVVDKKEWDAGVAAINASIRAIRQGFPAAIESISPSPDILDAIWHPPSQALTSTSTSTPTSASAGSSSIAARSAIMLLLSPVDSVHEPVINLLQQSFDADDRADCFRALLTHFPGPAMDGLCQFLSSFIATAKVVPEACSLAKRLVRCFTDILDVLCQPHDSAPPLLQSEAFTTTSAGKRMGKRVEELWNLMSNSLALIFKRTLAWAPYYENVVMVDWMRDALIFGRGMTDHIRAFEAAALSRIDGGGAVGSGAMGGVGMGIGESPAKMTHVGKSLVQKLETVLSDLVLWLRLTDAETLHQTFELIKTILSRIVVLKPDLSTSPALEATLIEIDKFCRRVSSSYNCRLTDDRLSELADLLDDFDLPIPLHPDDDVQLLGSSGPGGGAEGSKGQRTSSPATTDGEAEQRAKGKIKELAARPTRDAFQLMMQSGSKGKLAATTSRPSSSASTSSMQSKTAKTAKPLPGTKQRPITLDDFEDDTLLDDLSAADLDILERKAKAASALQQSARSSSSSSRPSTSTSSTSAKLNINVVPKMYPAKPVAQPKFKSKLFRELHAEHRFEAAARKRDEGAVFAPRLPVASGLGTGLGAYQGKPVAPKPAGSSSAPGDSGSSASESSDEDSSDLAALLKKPKSPAKRLTIRPEQRRSIKLLDTNSRDILRMREEQQREDRKAAAHRMKMRIRPDLNPLYRHVLAWSPDDTGTTLPLKGLGNKVAVPTVFNSSQQYDQVMLPLYLQELWSQFRKGDNDVASSPTVAIEVSSRAYEDDFIDLEVVAAVLPPNLYLNDTDLITLKSTEPGSKAVFAKVIRLARKFKDSVIRLRVLAKMDQRTLATRSRLQLKKYMGLNTALREFAALRGLPYYEPGLLSDVLEARSAPMPNLDDESVQSAMKTYSVNEPQAKAILGSMRVKGFALIQGPPGTGKTKTIAGLVGKFLSERQTRIPLAGEKPTKAKLLVCAPSNAAIDEVCKRLVDGVPSPNGRLNPSIVRIGHETSVNINVKDVSLDSLVEARVTSDASATGANGGGGDYARLQSELDEVKQTIKSKQDELRRLTSTGKNETGRRLLESEIHTLNTRRSSLGQSLSKTKDAARDATRNLDGARRAAKEAILNEADVICATLSGAGQDVLAGYEFETVVIDEAAQAIEMSCLIPLKYGCQRCIMVGDPNQLPPTTFSVEADQYKYNQSLFVRIAQQKGSHMHLLSIQYRMHPFISELPSKIFYDGRLHDGPGMATKTAAIWHHRQVFGPYRFFDVSGTEVRAGTSTKNPTEAAVAVELYNSLDKEFGAKVNLALRIGVITMYREQLYELKRKFNEVFGSSILEQIEFNTVDGFQGQEKDIIILSTVRSGPNLSSIGFLRDFRRMNVALTRAKSSLFVIGNAATLERSDERWRVIVGDARDRGFLVNYDSRTFDMTTDVDMKPAKPIKAEFDAIKDTSKSVKREKDKDTSKVKGKGKKRGEDSESDSDDTVSTSTSSSVRPSEGRKKRRKQNKNKHKIKEENGGRDEVKREDADDSVSGPERKRKHAGDNEIISSATSKPTSNGPNPTRATHPPSSRPPLPPGTPPPPPPPSRVAADNPNQNPNPVRPPPPRLPVLGARPGPGPSAPPRPPPQAAPPRAEDVVFMKKKKKLPPPPPRPGGNVGGVINRLPGGGAGPPPAPGRPAGALPPHPTANGSSKPQPPSWNRWG